MHLSFYFSTSFHDFLFKGVNINSKWGMAQLCLGIATLSALIEILKAVLNFTVEPYNKISIESVMPHHQSLQAHVIKLVHQPWVYKMETKLCYRVFGLLLHTGIMVLNFLVMLAVMSFNAYFLIAAVSGYGLGYLLFGFLRVPSSFMPVPPNAPAVSNQNFILNSAKSSGHFKLPVDSQDDSSTSTLEATTNCETVPLASSSSNPGEDTPSSRITVVKVEVYPS